MVLKVGGNPLSIEGSWEQRLQFISETMREMSRQSDPQLMVQNYGERMRKILPTDGFLSLSRRELDLPSYRITRSSTWSPAVNPWKDKDRLPTFDRGILGRLIYGNEAVIIDDLDLDADDPAAAFLAGHRSLLAIPLFDQGVALNMVVRLKKEPHFFQREHLPELVWMSNLFGRATQTLVLSAEVKKAYDALDREMQAVEDIQRSLLPLSLPAIPGVELAAYYQTSRRAGGDYYDFFKLPDGRWGILMADVSGHGTPAAVLMAITHSIAHSGCNHPEPPAGLLAAVNLRLSESYTTNTGNFVTAFYGIYDPATHLFQFARAGHCQPRVRQADGAVRTIEGAAGLPLGIDPDEPYEDATETLAPGETIVLYTDGIIEARNSQHGLFGTERLDEFLKKADGTAEQVVDTLLQAINDFAGRQPLSDDRTLLVMRIT